MAEIEEAALGIIRKQLGRRRFRMAMLRYGYDFTQQQIAKSMRICQQMVSKDLKVIERRFGDISSRIGGGFQAPSLN